MELMLILLIAGIFLIVTPFVLFAGRGGSEPQDGQDFAEAYKRTRDGRE